MKQRVILWAVFLILISIQASAATVYGTIYDFSLTQTGNVRVTINTVPQQHLIAVNGRYSFNAAPGEYTIQAEQLEFGKIVAAAQENITVGDEGSYVRDIVLFPYFGEEEIFSDADSIIVEDVSRDQTQTTSAIVVLLGLIVIILGLILWRMKKLIVNIRHVVRGEHKTELANSEFSEVNKKMPADLQEIVDFIKSQDNRVTQKEIRKKFPQSEAKISLLVADLEKRGLVEKIKKGRGNIVILKN